LIYGNVYLIRALPAPALSCCRSWPLAMLIFCNTPDELQCGLIFANVTLLLKVSTAQQNGSARWKTREADDHALVPVAFEIGCVSGAVCAGVPARGFVRARASRARRAALGVRERARGRAGIGRRPRRAVQSSRS